MPLILASIYSGQGSEVGLIKVSRGHHLCIFGAEAKREKTTKEDSIGKVVISGLRFQPGLPMTYTSAFGDGPRNFEPCSSETKTTPELSPSLLTSTPTGGRLSFDGFHVHPPLYMVSFNGTWTRTHDMPPPYDSVTLITRLLRPSINTRAIYK
ncbi:hypothetical protein TNCV_2544991 [Trichonephila clavipes]|nr:hypothetical protein TNCV_2544991 [Trichonephila clavipes]